MKEAADTSFAEHYLLDLVDGNCTNVKARNGVIEVETIRYPEGSFSAACGGRVP